MRILSLGIPLPDPLVDNYDWARAPSFFDYDAVVVEPQVAVSDMVQGVVRDGLSYTSYNEEPIENGPTTAITIGLADLLRRRQDEIIRFLSRGGLLVCFAYVDAPHPGVAGLNGCHRFYWLPAPTDLSYGSPYVQRGEGHNVQPTDHEHPFAAYLERFRDNVAYRATFTEGAAGFGRVAKVIARSPGGAALALDLPLAGGRLIFLPAMPLQLAGSERTALAAAMVAAIRDAILTRAEGPAPTWLANYPLPGLEAAQSRLEKAEEKLDGLEAEVEEARIEYQGIDLYRRLLWQTGKYGLDLPVRDALAELGLSGFARADEPGVFSYEGETIFLETEAGLEAIGMEPHYRLRQRIEQRISDGGSRPRGLIVINGYRRLPPEERPQQYSEPLRVAAESMRYCVVESTRLFEAVEAVMAGDKEVAIAFCRQLIETEGVLSDSAASADDVADSTENEEEEGDA